MQDDPFPAAERILSEIETVFKKDPKLKEFDIVPVTVNHNKSPVLHVAHCLGLESWCVRHVYCYTYHRLMDARQLRSRREDPALLARLLLGALLLNPDVTTFWNMRRELLQASRLDMQGELHFTAVLLSRKPKCAEAFAHRKWVVKRLLLGILRLFVLMLLKTWSFMQGSEEFLRRMFKSSTDFIWFIFTDADKDELLEKELQVSQYAADRYPNNYHAWSHRMWCLTHLASFASAPLLKEWGASETWVSSHVSDHSGLQYRQFLLNHLLELKHSVSDDITEKARKSILQFLSCSWSEDSIDTVQSALIKAVGLIASELLFNTDLILRFAGHEALWCHRRYLLMSFKKFLTSRGADMNGIGGCRYSKVSAIINRCAEKSSEGVSALHKDKPSNHMNVDGIPLEEDQKLSSEELAALDRYLCHLQGAMVWHEVKLINSCRPDELHQQRLAKQHHKWLSHVLKLDIPAVTCRN